MRRGLLVATIAFVALHGVASHAGPIASCGSQAGPNGVLGNPSVSGVCSAPVPVTETGEVTIRLHPGPAFTGVLTAKVTAPGYGGLAVTGIYVAGELVNGMDEDTLTLVAAEDAVWTLSVSAGDSSTTSTYLFPPLPQQATIPGAAFGRFGAEVVPAASQA
ncbi:MAG TPA: hypothetical protein VM841_05935 [Actinomycetota bacterium]|nr:hypothetical protein [Actinomycetota bacterium]